VHTLLQTLSDIVGPSHLLTAPELRARYETDCTGRYHGHAHCVVRPATTAQTSAVLAACHAHRCPVVPQGGNSGLVGGAVPHDAVVLSTERLNRLSPIDTAAAEVVAEAGVRLEILQNACQAAGLVFGVDMASRGSATIGGMVSTNAGGLHVLRYGSMRAQIIGVEAVQADGTIFGKIPGLRKDNTGYNFPSLLTGAEGTLAVVTRAHLLLHPALPHTCTALLALADIESAVILTAHLRLHLPSLHALEIFFAEGMHIVAEHFQQSLPFPEEHSTYLLVECADTTNPLAQLAAALTRPEVQDAAVAEDSVGRERLWRWRERHTEAIRSIGIPHKLDIALPLRSFPAFTREVHRQIIDIAPHAQTILFGHIGDGNLHVNILGLSPDDMTIDEAVFRLVSSYGGSISAEHGIGKTKRPYLLLHRSSEEVSLMRQMKEVFDPHGILNPEVLL